MEKLKKGDRVVVMDQGLLMLQKFMTKGKRPNNVGWVYDIWEDGTVEVTFPIGSEDPNKHSQNVPYPPHLVIRKDWKTRYKLKF